MRELAQPRVAPESPMYPIMSIGFPPTGGILISLIYSAVEKRDLLIPQDNALAMCKGFLQQQVAKKPLLKAATS